MVFLCGRQATEACFCCLSHREPTDRTQKTDTTTHSDFAIAAFSAIFPNSYFTNHESLPPFQDSFSIFATAFPNYKETLSKANGIRDTEYPHLADHVCFDYSGVGLFSHSQMLPGSYSVAASPLFRISYKPASLKSEVLYGEQETDFESSVRKQLTSFLNISADDYGMVCTASRTAAFRLLAESYPFQSNKRLITVYDYESEAVNAMTERAQRRGAKVVSASFSWPRLSIHSAKLKKLLRSGSKEMKGLLVFPLMSRVTGVRYPYLWMKMAQEKGWHVALDACTLCPKEMDTMGMTLIQPDFVICSFYKVFGENPSGFAGLFIKKSSRQVMDTSLLARSIGVVTIGRSLSTLSPSVDDEIELTRSFSGSLSSAQKLEKKEEGETSEMIGPSLDTVQVTREKGSGFLQELDGEVEVEFRGLHHADSLGLLFIQRRLRYITNWLVIALTKLKHPLSGKGNSLVRIYGPEVKFDRGPAIAFNVFDWKGEKLDPSLVQKLADRSNISLSCGFLQGICFRDRKYEQDKRAVLQKRAPGLFVSEHRKWSRNDLGIPVVSASLGFLVNFEDAYKLWAFIARFLDADFVEKERWRFATLNQKSIEV
ncbi:hypothetical protein HPP92_008227 [Vanilla planifolia]|uniref:Molybdenum cofactor sulfurase n=1 Tax=Vanilla planifolia TaxID=51239 RepID=A0A835RHM4_VANPL|nr:hypothetical protein HPP92_008227 [Vanilla planifolia]